MSAGQQQHGSHGHGSAGNSPARVLTTSPILADRRQAR